MVEKITAEDLEARRLDLARALRRALQRAERRVTAIEGDLARAEEAEHFAASSAWLVAAAAQAPRGARELRGTDWSTGEARDVLFPLDPAKSAREQVELVFHRARRLRRARPASLVRLAEARRTATQLAELLVQCEQAPDQEAVRAVEALARPLFGRGPLPVPGAAPCGRSRKGPRAQERLPPFRSFVASGGLVFRVGKGARQNDELTTRIARPHQVWLHAKGWTGAHVVAQNGKGQALTAEQLVDGGHLAAHFSDARGEAYVEVSYVERRHVRKPRGSPPGQVLVDREKVLKLRAQPEILARLLAAETADHGTW